jgi:hypothetical protein
MLDILLEIHKNKCGGGVCEVRLHEKFMRDFQESHRLFFLAHSKFQSLTNTLGWHKLYNQLLGYWEFIIRHCVIKCCNWTQSGISRFDWILKRIQQIIYRLGHALALRTDLLTQLKAKVALVKKQTKNFTR